MSNEMRARFETKKNVNSDDVSLAYFLVLFEIRVSRRTIINMNTDDTRAILSIVIQNLRNVYSAYREITFI